MVSGIDILIRTHDLARMDELSRAVFSAALQDLRPARLVVVCQRFGPEGVGAVRDVLAPVLAIVPEVTLDVRDWPGPPDGQPQADGRAALLNMGLAAATARFCAILDYDDVIYPEAYRLLAAELERSGAAIAFGGVLNTTVTRAGLVPYTVAKHRVFHGDGLSQLLRNNFCPVHSFLLDRSRIDLAELQVDPALPALEDYDLLLRIVARHRASFRLKDTIIGEYLLKDDGSNLNPLANPEGRAAWAVALAEIRRRKTRLTLSPQVQADLGVAWPGLTVADYLATLPQNEETDP